MGGHRSKENVLDVFENGYKIPFKSTPKLAEFKNNKSALLNDSFVSDSIQELLRTKRVVDVPFKPHVVSPLSVSTNKGKSRLILDLRYLHVWTERVKFEDWKAFQNYLSKEGSIFPLTLSRVITMWTSILLIRSFWDFHGWLTASKCISVPRFYLLDSHLVATYLQSFYAPS